MIARSVAIATVCVLAACDVGSGPPPFDIGESQGCFQNPNWTPAEARRPPPTEKGLVQLSPIPGESGVSATSSCLSGSSGR